MLSFFAGFSVGGRKGPHQVGFLLNGCFSFNVAIKVDEMVILLDNPYCSYIVLSSDAFPPMVHISTTSQHHRERAF